MLFTTKHFIILSALIYVVYLAHQNARRFVRQENFDNANLKPNKPPCMINYAPKRYMWQHIPPARNGSIDIRAEPLQIGPAKVEDYGIFQHTDMFGNQTNARVCQ